METKQTSEPTQVIVVMNQKSVGVTILLTVLFGPLGMFYSTVAGGIVMFLLSLLVGIFTLGFGLIVTWPICIIWAVIATNTKNKKLVKQ